LRIFHCPACGKGKLFKSLLTVADGCSECGLSFTGHEQGDGPAFLSVLLIGALTGIFAAIVEIKFAPPFWLHALIWIPFVIGGSLFSLRLCKAAIVAAQYRYRKDDFN
jgi:uncharacterized protein (DUF983 family)